MVMRCYEQIRVSQGVMKLPITIVGVGSGYSYDDLGSNTPYVRGHFHNESFTTYDNT